MGGPGERSGEEAVEEAVAALRERLSFSTQAVGSYTVIRVGGCDAPDTIPRLGRFLTGVVAQMVAIDLRLVSYLSARLDGQAELRRDLDELLGAEGELFHSGGGFLTHFPDQGYRFVEVRDLPS